MVKVNTSEKDYTEATHIAVCPHYFGKGFDVAEAKQNLKASGGTLSQYVVYKLPPGAVGVTVDDFGGLRWRWLDDADRDGQPEIVASRGVAA